MADDRSPQQRPESEPPDGYASGAGQGWVAVSYLFGGIALWGVVGWLVDGWLHTGGIATAIGSLVGAAGGVYMVVLRLGRS